jgi:hypothetical protein
MIAIAGRLNDVGPKGAALANRGSALRYWLISTVLWPKHLPSSARAPRAVFDFQAERREQQNLVLRIRNWRKSIWNWRKNAFSGSDRVKLTQGLITSS